MGDACHVCVALGGGTIGWEAGARMKLGWDYCTNAAFALMRQVGAGMGMRDAR